MDLSAVPLYEIKQKNEFLYYIYEKGTVEVVDIISCAGDVWYLGSTPEVQFNSKEEILAFVQRVIECDCNGKYPNIQTCN